jgi:hypothetical protein
MAMKMDWKDMVTAMAELSETERLAMMIERLAMFADLPADQRKREMQAMMMARESLPPAKRDTLKRSMEAAAMQLPADKRQLIMRTQEELMSGMAMAGAGAPTTATARKPWWKFWG